MEREAETALVQGHVTRELILDNVVDIRVLQASPYWECDPITGNWFKRPMEFFAVRAAALKALPEQQRMAEIALAMALLGLAPELPPQADGPALACFRCGDQTFVYERLASFEAGEIPPHITSGAAIQEWRARLLVHVATHSGDVLWWRCRPEIRGKIPFGEMSVRWAVYSRLVTGSGTPDPVE